MPQKILYGDLSGSHEIADRVPGEKRSILPPFKRFLPASPCGNGKMEEVPIEAGQVAPL